MGRRRSYTQSKPNKLQKFKNFLIAFATAAGTSLLLLVLCVVFIFYGPFHTMRDIWITTAMGTFTHQYLATAFFSEETIAEVMEDNTIVEPEGTTNPSLVHIATPAPTIPGEPAPTEEPLKTELIRIDQKGYKGYLIVIEDPSRVYLALAEKLGTVGQRLPALLEKDGALGGINASGFKDPEGHGLGGEPTGIVICNGELLYDDTSSYHMLHSVVGFNRDNILIVGKYTTEEVLQLNLRDAVEFSPILITNGITALPKGNSGGINPRTAIGQRADGAVLLLVIDGRQVSSIGCSYSEAMTILEDHGAVNACALDGGSSSTLVYDQELKNNPCGPSGARLLPNSWAFK